MFDLQLGVFRLHAVLPPGMVFPFDFGSLPKTLGDDRDPLDVLVLIDEPVAHGAVVSCRLLGVIEAEQGSAGGTRGNDAGKANRKTGKHDSRERNDRLLAVAARSRRWGHCRSIDDPGCLVVEQIEHFFIFYNAQSGVAFRPLAWRGPAAGKLVQQGAKAHDGQQ